MKKGVSQSILSIFLASMLLFGAITIASNSNFGNTMMLRMQSAEADGLLTSIIVTDDFCEEFGDGDDNSNCETTTSQTQLGFVQTPDDPSNLLDGLQIAIGLNDCDEFDPGDNEAHCVLDIEQFFGPIEQTNNPGINPVGSNVINIVGDDDMVNNCDESGASGGTNFAECRNEGSTIVGGNNGITEGITQNNFAIATDNLDNPNFAEVNTVDIFQRYDLLNECSEMQEVADSYFCGNDVDNFIGPVEQSNTVIGEIPEQPHTNTFAASQIATAQNDCDESGSGASTDLLCENGDTDEDNTIESVHQENTATNTDNAVQTNDATSVQSFDSNNDCNESDDGDNTAVCDTIGENRVGPVDQSNEALGHQDSTIFQNNQIDGDDAADIPGINQVITADNTCDEIGVGTNIVECDIVFLDNTIDEVNQANIINEADSATDIFQDNRGVFSQIIDADNDCDETGIGGGDNDAECKIRDTVDNFLGVVNQGNGATGEDNSLFDQDNNVDVSQGIVADNDCNASGNSAFCAIGIANPADPTPQINFIDGISQESTSQLIEDAFSNQLNEVAIDQNTGLVNTCDESGTGLHDASCINDGIQNFVGPISQDNDATGEDSAVISETSNKVDIIQNMQASNDCDESDAGINLAFCENDAFNGIESITQTNTADGIGVDDIDQDNFVSINQNLQAKNDCDESAGGDNNAECTNSASNNIESITQTNDAVGDGDDIFDQDNILAINQNLVTENDCDEFGLGDNEVQCGINISNDIANIVQENTDSDTDAANSLIINQDLQAKNNCDDSTSGDNTKDCSISLHLEVPDITQTGGEELTINQNDVAINTCPGGGTCTISRTTTFDPNALPLMSAFVAPFSLTSSEKNTNEDTQTEETTTGTIAATSFAAASAETQSGTVSDDDNQDNDDNSNTDGNDNGNDQNNVNINTNEEDDNSKLSAETVSETSNTNNQEDEDEQDETEGEEEGDDTDNQNQNTNNNDDDDDNNDNQNDDGNDNDQNKVNENDNEDEDEEDEDEDEDEENEDEDEGNEEDGE